MRLFNDKGRFLGLVNPIDALVVLSIVAVIFAAGWIIMNRGDAPLPGVKSAEIEQIYVVAEMRPEASGYLNKGDRVKNELSKADLGEIVESKSEPAQMQMPNSSGLIIASPSPILKDIYVTVRGKGRATDAMITINGDILEVGKKYSLTTKWFRGDAILVGLRILSE